MEGDTVFSRFAKSGFAKFSFSGGAVLFLTILLTYVLTEIIRIHYFLSYLIVLLTVTVVNYSLATGFIFKTEKKYPQRFFYYILSLIFFYAGDVSLMKLLTEFAGLYYLISVFFSRVVFFFLKFIYYKKVLFNDRSFLYGGK